MNLVHNQIISYPFDVKIGTKQGCNLSPTLFNIFTNDIPSKLSSIKECDHITLGDININLLMYADDIILLCSSEKGLQKSINMYNYCIMLETRN